MKLSRGSVRVKVVDASGRRPMVLNAILEPLPLPMPGTVVRSIQVISRFAVPSGLTPGSTSAAKPGTPTAVWEGITGGVGRWEG